MVVARPHKVLDSGALEDWADKHYPVILLEWKFSDAIDWEVDFWDYLEQNYPDVLTEFEDAKNVGVDVR